MLDIDSQDLNEALINRTYQISGMLQSSLLCALYLPVT